MPVMKGRVVQFRVGQCAEDVLAEPTQGCPSESPSGLVDRRIGGELFPRGPDPSQEEREFVAREPEPRDEQSQEYPEWQDAVTRGPASRRNGGFEPLWREELSEGVEVLVV